MVSRDTMSANVAWTLVAITVAAFLALEVFLLTMVVEVVREHNQRLGELECRERLESTR